MKWFKTFFILDGFVSLLFTLVLYLVLFNSVSINEVIKSIIIFILTFLLIFNIYFFGIYLNRIRKLKILNYIFLFIYKCKNKEFFDIEERKRRIEIVLSEAIMLIENPTPGPDEIARINEAVLKSKMNLCAVSSKDIYLWEDSTFLFYFILNGIKIIEELNIQFSGKHFYLTLIDDDINNFISQEDIILNNLAAKVTSNNYFIIRFLIYSQKVYNENQKSIYSLLRAHWWFGIHCIPLIKENLIKKLAPEIMNRINELSIKVEMKEYEFPDFLLIDFLNPKKDSVCVSYYHDGKPTIKYDDDYMITLADEVISSIARLALTDKNVIWTDYSIQQIVRCGIGIFK